MTVCNNPISRAKRLHFKSQTHIEHYSAQMNTPSAGDLLLLAKVSIITPLSSANIEGMCIWQMDTILRISLSRFQVSFTNRLATSEMKMKSILCLKLFRKLIKTHEAG